MWTKLLGQRCEKDVVGKTLLEKRCEKDVVGKKL